MTMRVETKTTATLAADAGRVTGWTVDREPGHISLAIPADRAKLTPVQARELAKWLTAEADRITQAERADAEAKAKSVAASRAAFAGSASEKAIRDTLLGYRVRPW